MTPMLTAEEELLLQKLCSRNISESMPAALDRCSTPPLDLCTTIEDLDNSIHHKSVEIVKITCMS